MSAPHALTQTCPLDQGSVLTNKGAPTTQEALIHNRSKSHRDSVESFIPRQKGAPSQIANIAMLAQDVSVYTRCIPGATTNPNQMIPEEVLRSRHPTSRDRACKHLNEPPNQTIVTTSTHVSPPDNGLVTTVVSPPSSVLFNDTYRSNSDHGTAVCHSGLVNDIYRSNSDHGTAFCHLPFNGAPFTRKRDGISSSSIVTPVKVKRLEYHLKTIGYDPILSKFLISGFKNGFSISHFGQVSSQEPDNHQSVADNLEAAQLLLQTELDLGRMAGPFAQPPFDNFRVSPLKLVPKPKSSKSPFRLVHNLSHPFKGDSINSAIPEWKKSVKYATILDAIRIILTLPKPVFTAKTDIRNTFKIVPVSPQDYHKLGIKFKGYYYYDKTLPPGIANACQIF